MTLSNSDRNFLQQALSGMSAGFTLTNSHLYVRKHKLEFKLLIDSVSDSSLSECYCCGVVIPGAVRHQARVTVKVAGLPDNNFTEPLCVDCAVPK